jgi:membrane fusion protein, multidrug efflux system
MQFGIKVIGLVIISATLFTGCKSKKAGGPQGAGGANAMRKGGPIPVEGFVVKTSTVSDNVEVPGTLLPFEETQIRAEVPGRVVQLNIQEGTVVKKGTLLVKLFDQDLQAQLQKLQVQLQIAVKTVERQKDLLAISGISQQDFDLSALNVDNLKADIQNLRISISKTEIRAPYDGTIGLRSVSPGSYLSPSDMITSFRQIDRLKLEFSIPEKYAKNITTGYKVRFRVDGGVKDHFATVMATEGNVEATTRTLKIRALVNELHPELVPGVFAKVNLQLGKDNAALMIPTQAILPQARNKQVILLRKDSAQFVVVQTGIRDSSYIQILSGLKVGDTVVTSGLMSVRPNAKIKVTKVTQLK